MAVGHVLRLAPPGKPRVGNHTLTGTRRSGRDGGGSEDGGGQLMALRLHRTGLSWRRWDQGYWSLRRQPYAAIQRSGSTLWARRQDYGDGSFQAGITWRAWCVLSV
ncbi:hypothetical protein GCM10010094_80300 [Streptomyces flaveus]|uniref:Uncharacterized protein n=1 Tax=Streptomyces flaveus TaxID=66370 RepID=A0A917RGV2_9ACTN|nr:hypothetical protein GCM10010094_80300 [Streptomyces flaveus]